MTEDFKVSITGDIAGLKKAVGEAEKELSAFASKSRELKTAIAENTAISRGYDQAINELKKSFKSGAISQSQFKEGLNALKRDEKETTIETARLRTELINLNREQAGLAKVTPDLTRATAGFNKTNANATNTMMEFSRVVQDAPYGIRGVANNIQQLVGNFGYLSKSAGGAKAAFSAMAASLAGPAGILLAVSLVTSLLVQYGDKLFKSSTEAEKLAEKQEKLTKSLEEYEKGLKSVTRAQLDGARNSSDELTTLSLLKSQLDNTNLSNEKRLEAFDELKNKYPTYLSNVTKEDSLIGGLDEKYDQLATAILNKAKAQAAAEIISDNYKKILLLQLKLEEDSTKLGNTAIANNERNNELKAKGALITSSEAEESQRSQKRYDKALKTAKDTANEIISLQTEAKKLTQYIDAQGGIIPLNFDKEKVGKTDPIRLPVEIVLASPLKALNETEQLLKDKFGRPIPSDQFKLLDNLPLVVGETNSQIAYLLNDLQNSLPNGLFGNLTEMSLQQLQAFSENFKKTAEYIKVIEKGIEMAVSDMAFALGKSIAEGDNVFEALGSSLLGSLGGILIQLGEMAIAVGIGLQAIQSALASLNPFLAIAAGVGLIALGSFFTSKSAEIGAFAGGGIVGGGSFNGDKVPAFVNSGEMILNGRQQGNLFDILDGNLRRLSAPAQNAMVQVSGELRGSTILLANARAEKNNSRFYGRK